MPPERALGDATPKDMVHSGDMVRVRAVMLMYAFRYALGRESYCVADVADELIVHRELLKPDWRKQIRQDIALAIVNKQAGSEGAVARWRAVVEAM